MDAEYRRKKVKTTPRFSAKAIGRTDMSLTEMEETGRSRLGEEETMSWILIRVVLEKPSRHLYGNVEQSVKKMKLQLREEIQVGLLTLGAFHLHSKPRGWVRSPKSRA